jgi:DNA-binding MarR family transcriptional regulator
LRCYGLRVTAGDWTFLTNHAHVLLCIARDPEIRLRDIAVRVGITERAAQKIVHDLADDSYVEVARVGRRNHYRLLPGGRFRHPLEAQHEVADLLALFVPEDDGQWSST